MILSTQRFEDSRSQTKRQFIHLQQTISKLLKPYYTQLGFQGSVHFGCAYSTNIYFHRYYYYSYTSMLLFDPDDQTIDLFYNRIPDDLLSDTKVFGPTADPLALTELAPIDQFHLLNLCLLAQAQLHDYNYTAEDFRDPLTGASLVEALERKGLIDSELDPRLNQYLLSSQSFRPLAFLATVHQDTPMEQLTASLDGLDRSIRNQTSQLKMVLDDNFENFVSCKKSIDDVLTGFKGLKSKAQQDMDSSIVFNPAARRRLGLDTDSGLLSELEKSINNLNLSSTLMIRPIIDHRLKEQKVSKLIEFVSANRFVFDLPKTLIAHLRAHDHTSFIDDYNRYLKEKAAIERKHAENLKIAAEMENVDEARNMQQEFNTEKTVSSRVYREIETIAEEYRRKVFEELLSLDQEAPSSSVLDVKFFDLVEKLHRLEKTPRDKQDPIYSFLSAQLEYLSSNFTHQCDKFEAKFLLMQKKLTDYVTSLSDYREGGSYVRYIGAKFDNVEEYFKASSSASSTRLSAENQRVIIELFESSENLDLSIINETWLAFSNYIKYVQGFFDTVVLKFVKNYIHYADPLHGYNVDPEFEIRSAFFAYLDTFVARFTKIFKVEVPVDQMKVTPAYYETFIPCHSNSLSAIFYLSDVSARIGSILTRVGVFTTQIGNTTKSFETNKQIKALRDVSSLIDQKIMEAICATWVNDCSQFYELENWEKYDNSTEAAKSHVHTKMLQMLQYYQLYVLQKLADLVFQKPASDNEVRIISSFPTKRILVSLEIQYMRSINVLIESILKRFTIEKSATTGSLAEYDIKQSIYKILTMNNFTVLGDTIAPFLIRFFDKLFDKSLLKQNLKLFADLDKIKITILDDINEHEKAWIESRLNDHFDKIDKTNSQIGVDSFVYDCLIHFVKLINIVKPITDQDAFVTIVQQLQTQFLIKFLLCLRVVSEKEKVVVRVLGNLKLDLDFFVEIFESSETLKLDDYCLNLVQITLRHIEKVEGIFKDLGYTQKELDYKLSTALDTSVNEFSCFR